MNKKKVQTHDNSIIELVKNKISRKSRLSFDEVMKDIEINHNHSWYHELLQRNEGNMEKVAIRFRTTEYSYGWFFKKIIEYSKALRFFGIKKGDEFVAILQQTPDYPILVAAASLIGAQVNLVSAAFDKDYIASIINHAGSSVVIIDDWDFVEVEPALSKSTEGRTIVISPIDKYDIAENPYKDLMDKYSTFDKTAYETAVSGFSNVIYLDEFLQCGEDYSGEIDGKGGLQDEIAVTYTSGSTSKGIHKGVDQRNATYIIMGRYHDPEVAGIPSMKNIVSYVAVPPHADTLLLTGVSDTLMQGGCVALDPIINEHYFLNVLEIYRISLGVATTSYWLSAMRDTYSCQEYVNLKLPYLTVPSEGGEPLSAGEERALNKWLAKVGAGRKLTHTPFTITKMSVGGGDSEHGSLFLSLFRAYYRPLQVIRGINEPVGMAYYNFAEVEILDQQGNYCKPNTLGRLVANSPISMEHYHDNPNATAAYFIKDAHGKTWGDMGCYAYKDKYENIYVKGRIEKNDPNPKAFEIADVILRDDKNIMSCAVIYLPKEKTYVAHIEFPIAYTVDEIMILKRAYKRCVKSYGNAIEGKILFRIRDHEEGFPLLFTAKRNYHDLITEGISKKCLDVSVL